MGNNESTGSGLIVRVSNIICYPFYGNWQNVEHQMKCNKMVAKLSSEVHTAGGIHNNTIRHVYPCFQAFAALVSWRTKVVKAWERG